MSVFCFFKIPFSQRPESKANSCTLHTIGLNQTKTVCQNVRIIRRCSMCPLHMSSWFLSLVSLSSLSVFHTWVWPSSLHTLDVPSHSSYYSLGPFYAVGFLFFCTYVVPWTIMSLQPMVFFSFFPYFLIFNWTQISNAFSSHFLFAHLILAVSTESTTWEALSLFFDKISFLFSKHTVHIHNMPNAIKKQTDRRKHFCG